MAASKSPKNKKSNVNKAGKAVKKTSTPVIDEMSLKELGLSSRIVDVLNKAGLRTVKDVLGVLSQGEAEMLAISGVGDKTLAKIQERLAEKGLLVSELTEVKQDPEAEEKAEPLPVENEHVQPETSVSEPVSTKLGKNGSERRVSFIVRLTVDEQGQPRRTEIEHAQSGKKETFPALDVQRLAAFIERSIQPISSPPVSKKPPVTINPLNLLDVRVSRMDTPDQTAMIINHDESFMIQVDFQLQDTAVFSLGGREVPYEIKIFVHEVTSGKYTLLATHKETLLEGVLEYAPRMQVPGLEPGLYRLMTLITVDVSVGMGGYHEGPMIRVVETTQPVANY